MSKDVFFFGAGFSKSLAENYPTLTELSNAIKNAFSEEENAIKYYYEKEIPTLLHNNIENLLTYLSSNLPYKNPEEKSKDNALYENIKTKISNYFFELEKGSTGVGSSTEPGSGTASTNNKEYILNDGTVSVFKSGKKSLELKPELMQNLNLLSNVEQEGTLKVENIDDKLYKNSNVVLNIHNKDLSFKPKFKNNKPVFDINIRLSVLVEEVDEENPNKSFLKRNKDFLTDELIKKTKETVKAKAMEIIKYCQENQVDLIGVYENFYRKEYKKFKKYFDKTQEKYLEDVEFNITVKVSSSY